MEIIMFQALVAMVYLILLLEVQQLTLLVVAAVAVIME
jgi:hypothetical protein